MMSLKLTIKIVAFFLGHPVYMYIVTEHIFPFQEMDAKKWVSVFEIITSNN